MAKNLVATTFFDWIELSSEYSMAETAVPAKWVGKSLSELGIREKYGLNVVGIIKEGKVNVTFNPQEALPAGGILIIIGPNAVMEKFKVEN